MAIESQLASASWSFLNRWVRSARAAFGIRGRKLPVRTISVGNLQAGGTGKTPCVAALARLAIEHGRTPLILTRGYRSRWEKSGGVLLPFAQASVMDAGDEALVLRELVPEAWIAVGAGRSAQFDRACVLAQTRGVPAFDLVILDDGLQHFALERDVDLVLVGDQTSNRVIYRERLQDLSDQALVVATGSEPWPHTERGFDLRARRTLTWIRGTGEIPKRCGLVTSIAHPERVTATLEAQGTQVVRHWKLPDHANFEKSWVEQVIREASEAQLSLVMTLKDWVKWREVSTPELRSDGSIWVIESHWEVASTDDLWSLLWE